MPINPQSTNGKDSDDIELHNRFLFSENHGRDAEDDKCDNVYGPDVNRLLHDRLENRPVFNYQNPDFGSRRRQYITYSSPGTSCADLNTTVVAQPITIEMNDFLNSERLDDIEKCVEAETKCAFPDESELVHRHHRITSIHRNATFKGNSDAPCRPIPKSLEDRRQWMAPAGNKNQKTVAEVTEHADNIVSRMQQDEALMENNHESELLRREALRDMPQGLTVKRIIKRKLKSSVSMHSKHNPISCSRRLKYYLTMKLAKMQSSIKAVSYNYELWYTSLKKIEGRFGSGVATYFKFLRWLFITNCFVALLAISFIIIPQLLFDHIGPRNKNFNDTQPTELNNYPFKIQNIFDGEGYFTKTIMYYGSYTTQDIIILPRQIYYMPYAYFFSMFALYFVSFCLLSISMATSYRQSFIETKGGLKNIYAHKILCGWDYSIATEEAAEIKTSSIYHELKELISDSENPEPPKNFCKTFLTYSMQIIINILVVALLIGIGYVMWFLLERHSIKKNAKETFSNIGVITAVIINIIMIVFPTVFGTVARYEDYKHPRAALYTTLIRTFLLKSVVVGVFIGFWLTHSNVEECWETSIGQHIYRLILFDFLFSLVLGTVIQITHYILYKKYCKKLGAPEFDIAQHTLQLMYNQTLFWVGFYFSPMLAVIVVIKLWCTWYLKRTFVLYICKPSTKVWRAAQTQTLFLILSFLSLLLVLIAHGYIIVGLETSNCGPLKGYQYMYEMIVRDIFKLQQDHKIWKVLLYLKKPGTVSLIFVAMSVTVYYLRAKAKAQKDVVHILKEMLVLEAKDKEFLLEYIANVTDGKWTRQLEKRAKSVWNAFENSADFTAEIKRPKQKEEHGDSGASSESSGTLLK